MRQGKTAVLPDIGYEFHLERGKVSPRFLAVFGSRGRHGMPFDLYDEHPDEDFMTDPKIVDQFGRTMVAECVLREDWEIKP